jgi:hypothetical protein
MILLIKKRKMAEAQLELRAERIWRKQSSGNFTEKGGGKDGEYRYSKVEIMIPTDEDAVPFVVARKGLKPTVIASVNTMKAVIHDLDERTVFLILRNHVGWTKGLISLYQIDFVDEIDSMIFLQSYNTLSASLPLAGTNTEAENVTGTALAALLETLNVEDEDKTKEGEEDAADAASSEENVLLGDAEGEKKALLLEDADEDDREEVLLKDADDDGEEVLDDEDGEDEINSSVDDDCFPDSQQDFPDGEFTF